MKLTGILREIEEIAGRQAALTIADKFGGTRVYLPAHVQKEHWLTQCVGMAAAQKIARQLSSPHGLTVTIPIGPNFQIERDRKIASALNSGKSAQQLAKQLRVTMRTIHRWRAAARKKAKQSA
jgi:Mor family transcriptional regulator